MSQPQIQLSRYSINPAALDNLSAAWMPLPYAGAIERFRKAVEMDSDKNVWTPYRQLNNALMACVPTLTHGFETYENNMRRALIVGTAQNPICPPTSGQLQHLLLLWANNWIQQVANSPSLQTCADELRQALSTPLPNFQWEQVDVSRLIDDVSYKNGMAFSALPSLLATLLHGQTTVIGNNQALTWRKVQGEGADRTGLYVVSQPFKGEYPDNKGTPRIGYFAYRLDFRIQTQAGRFNSKNKPEPWVFITLSCQRYAHESINEFAYGRNVSVLTGVRQARLTDHPTDNTLVRLVLDNQGESKPLVWRDQLPRILEAFGARKLTEAVDLRTDPARFANLHSQSDWLDDEYLIVHTEGIHYGVNRKRKHALKTGFPFAERRAILDSVVSLLGGILIPNEPLSADIIPTPSGIKTPLMLRSYSHFIKRQKSQDVNLRKVKQLDRPAEKKSPSGLLLVQEAIRQALPKQEIRLLILHQTHASGRLMVARLKYLLGIEPDNPLPDWLDVKAIQIPENNLLEPLKKPEANGSWGNHLRQEHVRKREAWSEFFTERLSKKLVPTLAIVEMPIIKQKGVSPLQSIKGAVREACVRAGINSQMLQLMQTQSNDSLDELKDESIYRLDNAFLDLLIRHTGALYGSPSMAYHHARLPENIANQMDIVAIYRHQTQPGYGDIHYALAVRLQAKGIVDVLLPGQSDWMPYLQAGPVLGRLFAEARKEAMPNGKRDSKASSVKLANFRLKSFLTEVIKKKSDQPTLLVIDADVWRNARTDEGKIWPQLQNGQLAKECGVININEFEYPRDHPELAHILGIIRLRDGAETPDYLPVRESVEEILSDRDFAHLSGFVDNSVTDLLHYFSVGRLPETQKAQRNKNTVDLFKLQNYIKGADPRNNHYGVDTAFKHQQAIEMVPFYVHADLNHEEGKLALCRAVHWSRISPAWSGGNTVLPYPMHLAKCLVEDQLCIVSSD